MTDRSLKLISCTTQTLGKRRAGIEPHTRTSALGLGRGPCFNSIQKQEFPKRQAVTSSILIPLLPCAEERGAPLSSSIQHNPELSRSTWEPHALPTLSHIRLEAMWRHFPPQTGSNSSKANKRTTKEKKKIEEDSRLPNSDTIFGRNMALDRITGTQIAAVSTKHSSVQEDPKDISIIIRYYRPVDIITQYPTEPTTALWEKTKCYNPDLPQVEHRRSAEPHQHSHGNVLHQRT